MQAMKGATVALGSMNRSMNLPALQRIAMEFERENDIMEQRQEMMDDAVDDAMDVGVEEEGDELVFGPGPEHVWCWGWDGAGDLDGPDVDPIWEHMSDASSRPDAVRVRHNRSFKMH